MSDSTSAAAVPGIPAEEKETGLPSEAKAEDARWVEGAGDDEGDLDAEGDEDEYFRQHFKAATEARPVGAGSGSGVEGGGEGEEYEEGFEDAGAIAGAGAAAESEEDSRYPPDLILGDGRIISRKPRPTQEEDELDESKKDITMANAMKEEGNRNFTEAKYDTAVACYTEALRFVPKSPDFLEHKAVFYANRAACYLQLVSAKGDEQASRGHAFASSRYIHCCCHCCCFLRFYSLFTFRARLTRPSTTATARWRTTLATSRLSRDA